MWIAYVYLFHHLFQLVWARAQKFVLWHHKLGHISSSKLRYLVHNGTLGCLSKSTLSPDVNLQKQL